MKIIRLLAQADKLVVWFAGLAIAAMMIQVCIDVIGKFVFNAAVPATIATVSNYYMPLITFLPLAYLQRQDKQISVELFTQFMPNIVQRLLYVLALVLSLFVAVLLIYTTWSEAVTKHAQRIFTLEHEIAVPIWPSYYFLPLGYGLFGLMVVAQLVAAVSQFFERR